MYSNYGVIPSFPQNFSSQRQGNVSYANMNGTNNDRFVGGFLGPFILGGITGGLLAPAFYPKPYYYPRPYYPYPYYGPYYR